MSDPSANPVTHTSRRSFLKHSAAGLCGLLASACGLRPPGAVSPASTNTPAPSDTPLPPSTPAPKSTRPPRKTETGKPQAKVSTLPPAAPVASSGHTLILGRPTATSISASVISAQASQIHFEYGLSQSTATARTDPQSVQAGVPLLTEIAGLQPDSPYFYRLVVDGTSDSEHTFHTQRASGSPFTFTIDADPHNRDPNFNAATYTATLNNARADAPDFHINLGDTFMTEKVQARTFSEAESTFLDMRPYFGLIAADAPLFLVNGNHEGEVGWMLAADKDSGLPVWSTQLRQKHYPCPIPGGFYSGSATPDPLLGSPRDSYYAWTWGDALLIALDPFWNTTSKPQSTKLDTNWNWSLGKEQYDWLKGQLESSSARFKFIFIHHLVGGSGDARGGVEVAPFYEWGGKNTDGSAGFDTHRPGWGKPIHQLLIENQVSAVFHGHDHIYVHQELDGIVYQECPQPSYAGKDNTAIASEYGYHSGEVHASSGHIRVHVAPAEARVEYVRASLSGDSQVAAGYSIMAATQ